MRIATGALRPRNDTFFCMGCRGFLGVRRGGALPRPTERFVGADDPVRPGPVTQHFVGQGPRALPGVRWVSGGRVRAPRPTEGKEVCTSPVTRQAVMIPPGLPRSSPGGYCFFIRSVVLAGAAAIQPRPIYTACIAHTRQTFGISGPSTAVGAFFAASGHAENHSDSDQKHRKFLRLHTLSPFFCFYTQK